MPTFYSDFFSAAATPQVHDPQKRAPVGAAHGRVRYARCAVNLDAVLGVGPSVGQVRLKQCNSGDRIHKMLLTCQNAGDTGDINLGLFESGQSHSGAEVDADIFMSAADVNASSRDQIEALTESLLDNFDRGKTLWEMANVGALDVDKDPVESWDITLTATEATTNTSWGVALEVWYTSGD